MDENNLRYFLSKLGITIEKESNGWLIASCPFAPYLHKKGHDYRPSFGASFNTDDVSGYFCHACHMHGRISSLARALGYHRYNNQFHYKEIAEAADRADKESLPLANFDELPKIRDVPQEPLVEEAFDNIYEFPITNIDAKNYLTSRGISDKTAYELELRYDPAQNRILFPIRNPCGHLMGFSGRLVEGDGTPKIRDYAGLRKRQHILGCHRWRWESKIPLIIVEGLFGYAHLVELGVEKVSDIGAVLGSYLTEPKAQLISKRNATTLLLSDNDDAGELFLFGKDGAISRLEKEGIDVIAPQWPEGKVDPDELSKRDIWEMIKEFI